MFSIEHQTDQNRFVVTSVDGHSIADNPAVLEYVFLSEQSLDFTRTYVPFRYRGKGLAEALVEDGLKWAKAQGYQMQASCWYVEKFLD